MKFTDKEIRKLAKGEPITDELPWRYLINAENRFRNLKKVRNYAEE